MDYASKFLVEGKISLVTGAGRGIGAACAEALASMGAEVICTDIVESRAMETAKRIMATGGKASGFAINVTDTKALEDLAEISKPLDILVCNAGIVTNTPAEEMTDDDWQNVIDVNLTGVFKTCRAFSKKMIANGGGAIVNIGSMAARVILKPQPQCHYNASKAGVHHLTKSLAVEWAKHGLRVNAVAPTYIATSLLDTVVDKEALIARWEIETPMKRIGKPHEVASAVQFLASDAASLITGSILAVDGGFTC